MLRRSPGFTLVEIAIAVLIIGVLAALAIPVFQRIRDESMATRLINDLRIFTSAFTTYRTEEGQWPAPASSGSIPSGMEGALPAAYSVGGHGGGLWAWTVNAEGDGVLHFEGSSLAPAVVALLDRQLDDGDLAGGRLIAAGSDFSYRLD